MANPMCRKRLQRELVSLHKNPVEHIQAAPHERNILEWHYVIEGPPGSPYENGVYHGVLRFPKDYPYKPPSILMFTVNGRFKTNTRLCLSMSDFHPETWNPVWSVSSILSGLLSFMLDSTPTLGSVDATFAQRRAFAARSLEENIRNKDFCQLFPKYVEKYKASKAAQQSKLRLTMQSTPNDNENTRNSSLNVSTETETAKSGMYSYIIVASVLVASVATLVSFLGGLDL